MNNTFTLSIFYRVKFFLIDLVSAAVYIFILFKKWFGLDKKNNSARIILYHSVGTGDSLPIEVKELNVSPRFFAMHMSYLKRHAYNIISIPEFYECYINSREFKKNTVVITFDDGYENVFRNAYPIIKRMFIPAALFVTYDFIESNRPFFWMKSSKLGKPLSWKQINLMKDYFNIYSHSLTHRNLYFLKDDELKKECNDSKRLIAERTKKNVHFFAYPYGSFGSFDTRTERFLKEAGYKLAFLNISGRNIKNNHNFHLKRTRVVNRDNVGRFKLKLAGAYDWLDTLKIFISKNVKE